MADPFKELLLLRHAKSDWKDPELPDRERPISDKGKKSVCKIAAWLDQQQLWPDAVWVSSAKRAQQTLKRLQLPKTIPVETVDALYLADTERLESLLANFPAQTQRLLWVGHNPGFEQFLARLIGSDAAALGHNKPFPTATLAHLLLPEKALQAPQASARLLHYVRPKDLKKTDHA
ncbi:SixA phosphatase family protein [Hydrogenovibrio halophilus]|uniref:SixA phosphatase family protein n=1 Tax=Hydrogenovibrio halophilus TaxID=373391 RepID=UPI00037383C0|nr:histidine phosphatase family protein [Hydrogenovibrio halophilus]